MRNANFRDCVSNNRENVNNFLDFCEGIKTVYYLRMTSENEKHDTAEKPKIIWLVFVSNIFRKPFSKICHFPINSKPLRTIEHYRKAHKLGMDDVEVLVNNPDRLALYRNEKGFTAIRGECALCHRIFRSLNGHTLHYKKCSANPTATAMKRNSKDARKSKQRTKVYSYSYEQRTKAEKNSDTDKEVIDGGVIESSPDYTVQPDAPISEPSSKTSPFSMVSIQAELDKIRNEQQEARQEIRQLRNQLDQSESQHKKITEKYIRILESLSGTQNCHKNDQ